MYEPKMGLTSEQRDILNGSQGPVMAKIMETVVMFGDIFGAPSRNRTCTSCLTRS